MALSQTELFMPRPSRRLIVPRRHRAWFGVDPGTARVAIAWIDGEQRDVEIASFPTLEGAERLDAIYERVWHLASTLAYAHPPGVIVVEQASGAHANLPLTYAVGVTLAAIYRGVEAATGHAPVVETLPSASWKLKACGAGNLYKPKGKTGVKPEDYAVLRWARENGYDGSSWDCADAWGIAEAARRTFELDER